MDHLGCGSGKDLRIISEPDAVAAMAVGAWPGKLHRRAGQGRQTAGATWIGRGSSRARTNRSAVRCWDCTTAAVTGWMRSDAGRCLSVSRTTAGGMSGRGTALVLVPKGTLARLGAR